MADPDDSILRPAIGGAVFGGAISGGVTALGIGPMRGHTAMAIGVGAVVGSIATVIIAKVVERDIERSFEHLFGDDSPPTPQQAAMSLARRKP